MLTPTTVCAYVSLALTQHAVLRALCYAPFRTCTLPHTQVNELDSAVNRAAEQPQRFGLTPEEISSRRKWITSTRRQVGWLLACKTANEAAVFRAVGPAAQVG